MLSQKGLGFGNHYYQHWEGGRNSYKCDEYCFFVSALLESLDTSHTNSILSQLPFVSGRKEALPIILRLLNFDILKIKRSSFGAFSAFEDDGSPGNFKLHFHGRIWPGNAAQVDGPWSLWLHQGSFQLV